MSNSRVLWEGTLQSGKGDKGRADGSDRVGRATTGAIRH